MCNWIHVPMNEKSPNSNKPTISGDKITGSWGGDGRHKFTLEKAP